MRVIGNTFKKIIFLCVFAGIFFKVQLLSYLVANSTPIVDFDSKLNSFWVNLKRISIVFVLNIYGMYCYCYRST